MAPGIIVLQGDIISGPEKELLLHVVIGKQIKFWSTIFVSEWTLGSSSKFVVDQNLAFQQFKGVTASLYVYSFTCKKVEQFVNGSLLT